MLVLGSVADAAAQEVFLCVWRNPERTMTRLFPDARDYRTVNRRIGTAQRAQIEERLGFALLPGQHDAFQYFEMLGRSSERIGHVIAASQRGQFGAIEFVLGLDTAGVVNGLYIQRARERDLAFRSQEFLDSLRGSAVGATSSLAARERQEDNHGRKAVMQGVLKELVVFGVLATEQPRPE